DKRQGGAVQAIGRKREELSAQLAELRCPEMINARFHLEARGSGETVLVSIRDGSAGYPGRPVLRGLDLDVGSKKRLALVGPNGSGKTTLMRAIMGDGEIIRSGQWRSPSPEDIGYVDQHYGNLEPGRSALEIMAGARRDWTDGEIRRHLADFLFRKNEEVEIQTQYLSGGERARLSLARIAARPPKLLLLDEITNNIDMDTRRQIGAVLSGYPAAMICISHDEDFLDEIEAERWEIQ
ncbi:MAG: ATP-binding cassette domain-containing protein, partial [Candidatus Adiutrix sp.]|nr:ATP-binding cassette domain-containing protein [Candidatus Adiutrix sp.]